MTLQTYIVQVSESGGGVRVIVTQETTSEVGVADAATIDEAFDLAHADYTDQRTNLD